MVSDKINDYIFLVNNTITKTTFLMLFLFRISYKWFRKICLLETTEYLFI